MRRIVIILLILSALPTLYGQEGTKIKPNDDPETKASGPLPDSPQYIPTEWTPMKYIRVNFHFMLKSPGDPDYPGNFTATDDGHGNTSYTGYDYARRYIKQANDHLADNRRMTLPSNNSTPVIETKYRYILDGVYFHEDNHYYCRTSVPDVFSVNPGRVINVFFVCPLGGGFNSQASLNGDRFVLLVDKWGRYNQFLADPSLGDGMWVHGIGLNHEIGHNLSLRHTMMNAIGDCLDDAEDYCPDTPTRSEIMSGYGFDPCCKWSTWNSGTCSNNVMDYGKANLAFTPHQLGRVHWTLEHEMKAYQACYFDVASLNICNFNSDQIVYMARSITVGGSSCGQSVLLRGKRGAHLIASQSVTLSPGFQVNSGTEFAIDMLPSCY